MEQEEYTKEKIDWSYIEFVDNQDVLDLIEKVFSFSFAFIMTPFFIRKRTLLTKSKKQKQALHLQWTRSPPQSSKKKKQQSKTEI